MAGEKIKFNTSENQVSGWKEGRKEGVYKHWCEEGGGVSITLQESQVRKDRISLHNSCVWIFDGFFLPFPYLFFIPLFIFIDKLECKYVYNYKEEALVTTNDCDVGRRLTHLF